MPDQAGKLRLMLRRRRKSRTFGISRRIFDCTLAAVLCSLPARGGYAQQGIRLGLGGTARRARNSKQEAPAFHICGRATTLAG